MKFKESHLIYISYTGKQNILNKILETNTKYLHNSTTIFTNDCTIGGATTTITYYLYTIVNKLEKSYCNLSILGM